MELTDLLHSYADGIRRLTGAVGATVCLPAPERGAAPLVINVGEGYPPPEFRDETARAVLLANAQVDPVTHVGTLPVSPCPCGDHGSLLVLLAPSAALTEDDSPQRRSSDRSSERGEEPDSCLILRFDVPDDRRHDPTYAVERFAQVAAGQAAPTWSWLLGLAEEFTSHAARARGVVRDPITGVHLRSDFMAILGDLFVPGNDADHSLSLLLTHPYGFGDVNRDVGRRAGDQIMREIAERLGEALRRSDHVFRYGGAVLGALCEVDEQASQRLAEKLHSSLSSVPYLDGQVSLSFSVGFASHPVRERPVARAFELVERADRSLHQAVSRGGGVVGWSPALDEHQESFDRMSGIFTGDTGRDYRNMALLWDTVSVLGTRAEPGQLAAGAVDTFLTALRADRVAMLSRSDSGELSVLHGLVRQVGLGLQDKLEHTALADDDLPLIERACSEGVSIIDPLSSSERHDKVRWAVPLVSDDRCLGCLLLEGDAEHLRLEETDSRFLLAVGSQLAMSLDRAELAAREKQRRRQEQRQLRDELDQLRDAVGAAKLIYRSEQMDDLVELVHRVAPTDATVLITGASGTGKELVARSLHALSARKDRPWMVVDCGAIATSLIDSELFGHVRGAYTGAAGGSQGRLAEADGGTVLLDEIGELPLEVQSKLLRFVQERQLVAVGATKAKRVDIRLLAATNRDLQDEVRAGRFREDLYYRLNVVHLHVPPLRQRPTDVIPLAKHFLRSAAVQYQRNVRQFSVGAERALVAHDWPGNVRELQNRVLKAVLLCTESTLTPVDLGLDEISVKGVAELEPALDEAHESVASRDTSGSDEQSEHAEQQYRETWQQLRSLLRSSVRQTLPHPQPLRGWLLGELLRAADDASAGVMRQGAILLGIPESTYRRRMSQTDGDTAAEAPSSIEVDSLREVLARLTTSDRAEGLWQHVENVLLEEIETAGPTSRNVAARLFDVSLPTYRRRLAELEQRATTPAG